jgi:hypothetical protein
MQIISENRALDSRGYSSRPQGKAAPVQACPDSSIELGAAQQPGHLHFASSASRRAKFAAAVRKAWGSSRNGGHCHFRQLKQQGWPQCAKDSSSHHGLPNGGSTSLYGRGELQTA